jgi:hypothetical protein
MCTVTYVPTKTGYLLTSNRDEKQVRKKALQPALYNIHAVDLCFPKDEEASGTWITAKQNGDALCLLNGAFTKFEPSILHTISRGLVVLEIATYHDMRKHFESIDLINVAPFTLIIVQNMQLFECRWDDSTKHIKVLDNTQNYIWSSATLYNETAVLKREKWFQQFLAQHKTVTQHDLFYFHENAGDSEVVDDVIMKESEEYATVSITSVCYDNIKLSMAYKDLIDKHASNFSF